MFVARWLFRTRRNSKEASEKLFDSFTLEAGSLQM